MDIKSLLDLRLILALAAMLVMTQAHAAQRSVADATAFFWDGSEINPFGYSLTNHWRIYETEDHCIVDIREAIGARDGQYVYKTTRINFRKMPEADAFTISEWDSRDYRSFVLQAEARLPDGAICELGREIGDTYRPTPEDVPKGSCSTSWRIWDNRGEEFLRHRLRALD
jgi:hypothetical protein